MKPHNTIAVTALALGLASAAIGQDVEIGRTDLGSGAPGQPPGFENAIAVTNNHYHAPQYLPGSPTAASIWPRIVEVNCRQAGPVLRCDAYKWSPRMGRGEYLFFTPVVVAAAPPRPVSEAPVEVPLPATPISTMGASEGKAAEPPPTPTVPARSKRPTKQDRR